MAALVREQDVQVPVEQAQEIVLHIPHAGRADDVYLIDARVLADRLWANTPAFITDPNSQQRRDNIDAYLLLKPFLRPMVEKLLVKVFGVEAPKIPKDADVLQFVGRLLISVVVGGMAQRQWVMNVTEEARSSRQVAHRVVGLVTDAEAAEAGPETQPAAPAE